VSLSEDIRNAAQGDVMGMVDHCSIFIVYDILMSVGNLYIPVIPVFVSVHL